MKILLLDVEMFANVSRTWGFYEQNVIKIERHRMICSAAWRWLGQNRTYVKALPDFDEYKRDKFSNLELMREVRDVMSQAQIVVGHNIDAFDLKRARTDMVRRDFAPMAEFRTIDTLKIARQKFGFNSNRLDDLCEFLGIPVKVKHPGYSMWDACEKGDPKAWALMRRYNKGDVAPCLEGVYRKLAPWYRPRWLTRMERGQNP